MHRFIPARAGNTAATRGRWWWAPVHPRTCGEHDHDPARSSLATGSSPHVRGTPRRRRSARRRWGFIPARAGNTPARRMRCRRRSVHPRTCGEHWAAADEHMARVGSSPHVRGTRRISPADIGAYRFIPARAGNTRRAPCRRASSSVHPRTCGEHASRGRASSARTGSSPHVRGTRHRLGHRRVAGRFIPARAGNTVSASVESSRSSVHPRTCGEHLAPLQIGRTVDGSSPHVRGTLPPSLASLDFPRFIPARAGNTSASVCFSMASTVHPRTCGEHRTYNRCAGKYGGSSPHVRGTRALRDDPPARDRFIPARAGNTPSPPPHPSTAPVHPRTCGEHRKPTIQARPLAGSSPHVRGTRRRLRDAAARVRFIPARAGNTIASICAVSSPAGSSPHVRGTRALGERSAGALRFIPARAGNTELSPELDCRLEVHPRTCGEHSTGGGEHPRVVGSSPHVRGTPFAVVRRDHRGRFIPHVRGTLLRPQRGSAAVRFIPARAGNTSGARPTTTRGPVHPRTCGEPIQAHVEDLHAYGSSPHVRGTLHQHGPRAAPIRFIPARAGNTPTWCVRRWAPSVHPRTCGEHSLVMQDSLDQYGSSPHVRGTLPSSRTIRAHRRFIPARAGNTKRANICGRPSPVHPRTCGEHSASSL